MFINLNSQLSVRNFKFWFAIPAIILPSLATVALSMVVPSSSNDWSGTLQFTMYALLMIALIWLCQQRVSAADFGLQLLNLKHILCFAIGATLLFGIATYLFELLNNDAQTAGKNVLESLRFGESTQRDIALILAICVMAPIGEEMVYRGVIFRSLRDGLSRWMPVKTTLPLATVISAALFAESHGSPEQAAQLGMLLFMGILTALVYEWTGSLFAPILFHSLNNSYVLAHGLIIQEADISHNALIGLLIISPIITFFLLYLLMRILPNKQ